MANLVEALAIAEAKTSLSTVLEALAVRMYFDPVDFDKDSQIWRDVMLEWENLRTVVGSVLPPAPPSA